jgi:hypothetical protein
MRLVIYMADGGTKDAELLIAKQALEVLAGGQ